MEIFYVVICINNFDYELSDNYVRCEKCNKQYEKWYSEHNGGYKCDSSIFIDEKINEKKLSGWYGSKYDFSTIYFTNKIVLDEYEIDDLICDNCIDKLCEKMNMFTQDVI